MNFRFAGKVNFFGRRIHHKVVVFTRIDKSLVSFADHQPVSFRRFWLDLNFVRTIFGVEVVDARFVRDCRNIGAQKCITNYIAKYTT